MKISFTGLDYEEGKFKFEDEKLILLREKVNPKKCTPFYAELEKENFIHADVISVKEDNLLDFLILDMEKCETRLKNSDNSSEKELMSKCLRLLEEETPLCNAAFSDDEMKLLKAVTMLSTKPVLVLKNEIPVNDLIEKALEKSNTMFFYTAGAKEVHAWDIRKGATILECADAIHSDLARGFIKGDVVDFNDFLSCHNMNEAKTKGLARLVDRDYIVQNGEVIEIRSGV